MGNVDQHQEFLGAREAAKLLGVKLPTLYAYTSRGLVRSLPSEKGRARRYAKGDLEQLKARHDARAGHGPVAGAALRWGEPVLESALTNMDVRGPIYRGHVAVELAERGIAFESVAELLWGGNLTDSVNWKADGPGFPVSKLASMLTSNVQPMTTLSLVVPMIAVGDSGRFVTTLEGEKSRARQLIPRMAACLCSPLEAKSIEKSLAAGSVASTAAVALKAPKSKDVERAINTALVVTADHELNPSSFTARVAASAGADLYACVSAALSTLSGPLHGGACDRIEALVEEAQRSGKPAQVIHDRSRRGEAIPGFGHRFYRSGDPRTPPVLNAAKELGRRKPALKTLLALVEVMRDAGNEGPTVDLALVALCLALGVEKGSATGLFALGRSAGLIAHALEQREAGFVLRPRARYTGPQT